MSEIGATSQELSIEDIPPQALRNASRVFETPFHARITDSALTPREVAEQTRLSGFMQHLIAEHLRQFTHINEHEQPQSEATKVGLKDILDARKVLAFYRDKLLMDGEFTKEALTVTDAALSNLEQLARAAEGERPVIAEPANATSAVSPQPTLQFESARPGYNVIQDPPKDKTAPTKAQVISKPHPERSRASSAPSTVTNSIDIDNPFIKLEEISHKK